MDSDFEDMNRRFESIQDGLKEEAAESRLNERLAMMREKLVQDRKERRKTIVLTVTAFVFAIITSFLMVTTMAALVAVGVNWALDDELLRVSFPEYLWIYSPFWLAFMIRSLDRFISETLAARNT